MITYPTLGKLVSVFSVVYAFLAVAHSAFSTGNNLQRMALPSTSEGEGSSLDTEDEAAGKYNYALFHLSFAMAACYTVLYVTFWQYSQMDVSGMVLIRDSSLAFWSRVVTSWIIAGLYIWSLFAPMVMEDRFI